MEVFPRSSPRPTTSHAERDLYGALNKSKLAGWRAWHSLRLRVGGAWEGEGDFVIACPTKGLLVLEVKGGQIELRDGHWLQNGKRLDKSPRDQGQTFVRNLLAELKRQKVEAPPFGVAVAFPDCEFSAGPQTGDLKGAVLGRRELSVLDLALPSLFKEVVPEFAVPKSPKWVDALHALWGSTWVPTVTLAARVEDAESRCVAMDAAQLTLLDMAEDVSRAHVQGSAGTGKTLLATELCRRAAKKGQRALYLSFTDALANTIDAQFVAGFPKGERPRAVSIRHYAKDLLVASGQKTPGSTDGFWKDVSFQAACEALPTETDRPALVVIDEAQDFEASDWELVEQLAGARRLWVFRDGAQAFWSDRPMPEKLAATLTPLKLLKQQRCPAAVWNFASQYTSSPVEPRLNAKPDAQTLRAVAVPESGIAERVRHEIDSLRKEGVAPEDIAVLTLAGQTKSKLFALTKLGAHALVRADAPEASTCVVMDTFLRFKGLERPFIIVAELAGKHITRYETRMHIALSRATVGAIVVSDTETAKKDSRLTWLI